MKKKLNFGLLTVILAMLFGQMTLAAKDKSSTKDEIKTKIVELVKDEKNQQKAKELASETLKNFQESKEKSPKSSLKAVKKKK